MEVLPTEDNVKDDNLDNTVQDIVIFNQSWTSNMFPADSSGWYRRHENNGWRLVSDRLMQTYLNDQTTYMTSMKKTQFSHTKVCLLHT